MNQEIVKSTNSELVEQIHYEFDVAGDNLFSEAETLLKDDRTGDLVAKSDRLSNLGFGASKGVKKSAQYIQDRATAKRNAELIEQYRRDYPLNKFINEASIKRICEKYGIVKGKVEWFVGEVPEKNLQEIENFRVKDEDALYLKPGGWVGGGGMSSMPAFYREEETLTYSENLSHELELRSISETQRLEYASLRSPSGNSQQGAINTMLNQGWLDKPEIGGYTNSYKKLPLSIVAPISDFDIKTFDLEKTGYDLTQKVEDAPKFEFNWTLEDPIVLQPVRGGHLIVSAWGDEASDPDVMNEIMN